MATTNFTDLSTLIEASWLNDVDAAVYETIPAHTTAIANHLVDPTDAHAASAITNTPVGSIAATTVQAAINELDTEKAALAGLNTQTFSVAPATSTAHAPQAAQLHGRNLFVNGSSMVDQLNTGALITPVSAGYPIDNVSLGATVASKLQSQRVATKLRGLGATHALEFSVLASYTPSASDYFYQNRPIEGINSDRLQWGTANAKAVSLQFKVNCSAAGTYSGALRNTAGTRAYPFSFTVAANTDTLVKVENIPGETSGVWGTGEGVAGVNLSLDMGAVASFRAAAGAWATGNYLGVTGSDNFVSKTNGSTFTTTDFQLEEGPVCTQFERKLYKDELAACQRYFPVFNAIPSGARLATGFAKSTTQAEFTFSLPVTTCKPVTGMTVTNASGFSALIGASSTVTTANALTSSSRDRASITTDVTGLTANQATVLIANNANCGLYFEGARI